MNRKAPDPVPSERCYQWADGALDATRMTLRAGARTESLDRASCSILERLLQEPGVVIDKRALLECGWPGRVVSDNSLSKSISRLRRLLDDPEGECLALVHGYGYRWTVPVVRIGAPIASPPIDQVTRLQRHGLRLSHRLDAREDRLAFRASGSSGEGSHVVLLPPTSGRAHGLEAEARVQARLAEEAGDHDDRVVRASAWRADPDETWLAYPHLDAPDLEEWATSSGGWRAVAPETRLSLIADLAEGVASYHRAGVAHGNLRPASLRIVETPDGPRGVLQPELLQAPSSADAGYRPPEWTEGAGGGLPADLHALGVLLYQAALGSLSRGFGPDWEDDVDDPLLRGLVRSLARWHPEQRGPAAAVLARQLRELPDRRSDLERLAASEADRRAAQQALGLHRRRLRWSLSLSAGLLLGGALAIWQWSEAREAASDAREAKQRAEAVGRFLSDSLLTRGDPYLGGVAGVSLREAMAAAAAMIDERFHHDPRGAAEVHQTVASSFEAWGDYEATERHQRRAIALVERLDGPAAPALAPLQRQLCQQLRMKGDIAGATAACAAAARVDREALGAVSPATRVEQAKIDYEQGHCEAALSALDGVRVLPPQSLPARTLADAWWFTGLCHGQLGDAAPAVEAFEVLVALQERSLGAEHPMTAWAKVDQAMAFLEAGDFPAAQRALVAAEAVFLATIGPEHPDFPAVTYGFAMLALLEGRAEAAAEAFSSAEQHWVTSLGSTHDWTLYAGSYRAQALAEAGRLDEAAEALRSPMQQARALLAARPAKAAAFREIWATTQARAGRWAEVEAEAKAIVATATRDLGASHPRRAHAHCLLGLAAVASGDRPAAAGHQRACQPLIARLPPTDPRRRSAEALRRQLGS